MSAALDEKLKNVRVSLAPAASAKNLAEEAGAAGGAEPLWASVSAALNILNS